MIDVNTMIIANTSLSIFNIKFALLFKYCTAGEKKRKIVIYVNFSSY